MFKRIREKYFLVGMLISVLISVCIPLRNVKADEANVHFGSASYSTTEGESFNVGVYVSTEQGVGPYVVTVQYDPTVLEYVGGADTVDLGNGLLGFSGNSGGPEVKYMVNFNVIGDADTVLGFNSAVVYPTEGIEALSTSVAGRVQVSVDPSEEEEDEEEVVEEEETAEPLKETDIVATSNVVDTAESQAASETQADSVEKELFLGEDYVLILGITIAILAFTGLVSILIRLALLKKKSKKLLEAKNSKHSLDSDMDLIDLDSDLDEYDEDDWDEVEEEVPEAEDDVVIDVQDVTMEFKVASTQTNGIKDYIIHLLKRQISYRKFYALNHVSFSVKKGEVVGIIGTNGSGKSTILKIVSGALHPTSGHVEVDRRKVQLLTLGTGFDMELTGRENVYLNGAIIGYSKKFLDEHYDEIVEFAELQDFMDEKVKNYSSGMVSRLGFAIATAGDAAEILILDEVLSVGDEFFRKKSLKRVKEMIHGGSTVLLVSHGMGTIRENCSKVVWIEKGELRMVGEPDVVCKAYQHMQEAGVPEPIKAVSEVS
ncbi:ABC transporter ATP-binding protein [Pseudobutyrivibrio sp. LB2011]|uniref:ABC transporter ATP-binding protein n=1 Tax=Pseudobutyrivibrio sp. LB2011 TaxID=1408312 RepID=UPI000AAC95D7|nr:ABC transporter ATP-binding protein [Pseudobutyrivibrio sp. LB2011]